ncbi:MAG TPA: hypothetical protein VN783_06270 [Thermoanaerobaculia bacterium]|nr:hypothetical protein [Thermoanaerobaculia bacterium]
MSERSRGKSGVEEIIDEILPVDWERLVRAYPIPALLAVAAGGYLLGRYKGPAIVGALSGLAAERVARFGVDLVGPDLA